MLTMKYIKFLQAPLLFLRWNFSFSCSGVPDLLLYLLTISCFRGQLRLDPYYCFLDR